MRPLLAIAVLCAATTGAGADGIYFAESFGVGQARGDLEPTLGNAIHSRLAIGARVRFVAIESWILADFQTDRVGAFRGLVGGDPAEGRADLEAYGFSVKLIGPIYRAPDGVRVEGYVRGGPSLAATTGMLDGYRGQGFGASAGVQITGRVRALGFLWTPLFFLERGPKITGSLFLDQGWDFYRLEKPGAPTLRARVGQVSVGFALGSSF